MDTRRTSWILAGVAAGALALSGCSTAEEPAVGASASCGEISLTDVVTEGMAEDESLRSIDGSGCDSGWTFAFVTVGPADGSSEGVYTTTMVFEAEGQFWIPRDRAEVCGTNSNDPMAYPADAQVPEAIWPLACQTN